MPRARGLRGQLAGVLVGAVLSVVLGGQALAATEPRASYRAALVDVMTLLTEVNARSGANLSNARVERTARLYAALGDREVDALMRSLPEARLRALVSEARRLMAGAPAASGKDVVVSSPNVVPGFCVDYPTPVQIAALSVKLATRHVIDAMEYGCHQISAGFSVAQLACEGPEIAAASAEFASQLADFCGDQQTASSNMGALLTERSVGQHLTQRLDVPMSALATQQSIDAAADSADASDDTAAAARTRLDEGFVRIDARLADALDDLSDLANDVTTVQAHTDDILFRVRVTQADAEDVEERSADLRARAGELDAAATSARVLATALQGGAAALTPEIEREARQQRRDDLGAALGDADAQISTFALPAQAGGRIEEAREVLIAAILQLQSLSQGNTVQALALLGDGDRDYNAGRYADAWRKFSAAYRVLDPHIGAVP
jgi:hypothetical protein